MVAEAVETELFPTQGEIGIVCSLGETYCYFTDGMVGLT